MVVMRRLAWLVPCAVLLGAAGCPGTHRDLSQPKRDAEIDPPDATIDVQTTPPVRVLTWNVRNLFNDVRDSPEIDVALETILPTSEYTAKRDAIAAVLATLAADIVVLQEVENQPVLIDLAEAAGGYPHRHITLGNDPRGIDIAVLSRHPIDNVVPHSQESFSSGGQTYKFARDVLEAHFTLNGRKLVLFGIHFKSGTEIADQDKRLAEAEQTRKIVSQVDGADPNALLVVLGDFNTVPGSPPLVALGGAPPSDLTSVTSALPAADRFSVTFGGTPQLYDDQLGDADAIAALDVATVQIDHGAAVNAASDHDPVVATYVIQ